MPGVISTIVGAISTDVVSALTAAGYPPLSEGKILLGSQWRPTESAPPRIIFTPLRSSFGPRAPSSSSRAATNTPYSAESLLQIAERTIGTDAVVFEVRCWGMNPDRSNPETVVDDDYDFTQVLYQAVLQSIQRLMPGNPVVMADRGDWTDAKVEGDQSDILGREFVFTTNPIPTPILDHLLPFVPIGTGMSAGVAYQGDPTEVTPVT